MFDKWFNQDIEKVLSKRNRVAGDEEIAFIESKIRPMEVKSE